MGIPLERGFVHDICILSVLAAIKQLSEMLLMLIEYLAFAIKDVRCSDASFCEHLLHRILLHSYNQLPTCLLLASSQCLVVEVGWTVLLTWSLLVTRFECVTYVSSHSYHNFLM